MKKMISLCMFFVLSLNLHCSALEISAVSAVLYEPVSGRVLFEKNKDAKMPMASTTKIVSAITAIENGNLNDIVTTSKLAADVEGSSIWLAEGEKQTLENLLYGMLLSSGNDAAIAVAEHVGGNCDNFAKLMNQTAKLAGATQSNFTNPSGLDHENHYTTAFDLAKITGYAMQNPKFKEISATKEYTIPWEGHEWNRKLKNHNKLLFQYEGCDGVKTGFTKKSGRCLVSSATKNGLQLIAVTLKDPDDWKDHTAMLDYGFGLFSTKTIVENGTAGEPITVKNGTLDNLKTQFKESVVLPVMEGDQTEINVVMSDTLEAPVEAGATAGYAEIYLNKQLVKKADIVVTEGCERLYVPVLKDYFSHLYKCMFDMPDAVFK